MAAVEPFHLCPAAEGAVVAEAAEMIVSRTSDGSSDGTG